MMTASTVLTNFPPDAEDALDLQELAQAMIDEATSTTSSRMLSASGFAQENISIVHQQIRCTNLAWALKQTKRVQPGAVVGIVGGSFSGLTLAVSLALTTDAIIYVFEKEKALFPRFRLKAHRHLSPILNSRFLGAGFDATSATPEFRRPIFAWTSGPASEVSHEWLAEFRQYDRTLPVFTFLGCTVRPQDIEEAVDGLTIAWRDAPHLEAVRVDLLIDATGFGPEANPHRLKDYSYWEGGHRLTYDHLPTPSKVLVSGCGDSGVIEGLHYALSAFEHREVEALWPQYRGLGGVLDDGVARARLFDIFRREDAETYGVISEVCWWLFIRSRLLRNPDCDILASEPHVRPMFTAVDEILRPLAETRAGRPIQDIDEEDLEDFIETVSADDQQAVRQALATLGDTWISLRLKAFADQLSLPANYDTVLEMQRRGVEIVLNGLTPTPYTRQLSPFNVWLMRILTSLPSVSYRQGKIISVHSSGRRSWVAFDSGCPKAFDRVVTRYGAAGHTAVALGGGRDTALGDHLLFQPLYTGVASDGGTRIVQPVRQSILDGIERLKARSLPTEPWDISKRLYVMRMLMGQAAWPVDDPLHPDPESSLASALKRGDWPIFEVDQRLADQIGI